MKGRLSTSSDELTSLQDTINSHKQGRMRRGDIQIIGIHEQPDSSSPKAVAKLSELLQISWIAGKAQNNHFTQLYSQHCQIQASFYGDTEDAARRSSLWPPLSSQTLGLIQG